MAKRQSFADKASKKIAVTVCPVCNTPLEWVKLVDPTFSEAKKSWKFKDRQVGICKCNEKEVLA
jgi:ribosomal protein L34E